MIILGISAFYHDSAAALLKDGDLIAAVQEERFSRRKHDARYPQQSIKYVLAEARCSFADVDYVVFYDKPLLKFERLLETYLAVTPRGFKSFGMAMPIWLREKLFLQDFLFKQCCALNQNFKQEQLLFTEHHISHAASAFYPSPFEEAVVLTLDGVGEWATTSVAWGQGRNLTIKKEIHFPHSLGLLYSAFTYHAGFKVNSGEYKLMGLAPYGAPRFAELIRQELTDVKHDGSFWLNQRYFNYTGGLTMTNKHFDNLFGHQPRQPHEPLTQQHMDMAASIQKVIEDILLAMTRHLAQEYNCPNLCMAGGVALNCVANGKIARDGAFKNIWIQPASGDAGGALGACFAAWHIHHKKARKGTGKQDAMKGNYLGPSFDEKTCITQLKEMSAVFHQRTEAQMIEETAKALKNGKAIGWFQGRMEFGPRALGARSIIADARHPAMQKTLNLKVKYRESFRPFAPSVLAEHAEAWFEMKEHSPYMLLTADVHPAKRTPPKKEKAFGIAKLNQIRSLIPAVTHVDYSARVQTVHKNTHPRYHALLTAFERLTRCPVLVNTSFNVRGEPIVCTPQDAFRCFMGTKLDMLVIENFILYKKEQTAQSRPAHKDNYELD